jgi:hypothetical protein
VVNFLFAFFTQAASHAKPSSSGSCGSMWLNIEHRRNDRNYEGMTSTLLNKHPTVWWYYQLAFVDALLPVFFSHNNSPSRYIQLLENITMSARVKETAKEEALHVRKLAEDGVKSGAYIYPLKVGNAVFN